MCHGVHLCVQRVHLCGCRVRRLGTAGNNVCCYGSHIHRMLLGSGHIHNSCMLGCHNHLRGNTDTLSSIVVGDGCSWGGCSDGGNGCLSISIGDGKVWFDVFHDLAVRRAGNYCRIGTVVVVVIVVVPLGDTADFNAVLIWPIVLDQVVFAGECKPADLTLEGSLPGVNPLVHLQI